MAKIGLIGHTGFVGSIIKPYFQFDRYYNKNNIKTIPESEFDLLVCAAPTGNRLEVQNNPRDDLEMILFLIDHLRKTKIKKFILLSTIDVLARPNTRYGMNRKILEGWIKNNLENYSIIRMPTLIHPYIKKNILYDLKHQQWLDKLHPNSAAQYYDLTLLKQDIDYVINNQVKEFNCFSEPIRNQDIVNRFFPELTIGNQAGNLQIYNVQPYRFDKAAVFGSMEKYFNETPLHLW